MTEETHELEPAARTRLRRKLKTWYDQRARDLPWRRTCDPYRIWISETMLQQTTVATVIPRYERFFETFPTLSDLANAEEQEVLKLWEGLGYYSRARNLWKAARVLVNEQEGVFPQSVSELMALPGVGRYTAGAIASFAFDQPAPIVEANTLRLYCRLAGYEGDPRSAAGQRVLWRFAEHLLPRTAPGRFNQALMELGSQICTPAEPACPACPVHQECRAFAAGKQAEIPRPAERVALTDVTEVSVAVRQGSTFLLRRRDAHERWAGLWDFPRFELADDEVTWAANGSKTNGRLLAMGLSSEASERLQTEIYQLTGIRAALGPFVTEIRHGVTRFRIRLLCFEGIFQSGRPRDAATTCWVRPLEFENYPLSTTGRKFANLLKNR